MPDDTLKTDLLQAVKAADASAENLKQLADGMLMSLLSIRDQHSQAVAVATRARMRFEMHLEAERDAAARTAPARAAKAAKVKVAADAKV